MKSKVKIVCIIFILLLLWGGEVFSQQCGDVNGSGEIDIVDALIIAQVYVGLNPANYDSSVADVNADGSIDIVDALLIAQYYVDLISSLNCSTQTPDSTAVATPTQIPTPDPTSAPGAYDCSAAPQWSASRTYDPAGFRVQYNGNLYENKWYTNNQNPEQNSGEDAVWLLIGPCDPSLTAAPTPYIPGTRGYNTRFWDCCKPHCAWDSNVPAGMSPFVTCNIDGVTLSSDPYDQSGCTDGSSYMCNKYIPWAVNSTLAYGFGATSHGDVCGKCFEMQYTGEGYYGDNPGAAAIAGKRMIIQAINIGHDVEGGQVDIMVPGGGVGAYNGCSDQWGIPNSQLGAQYGGLLTACQEIYGHQDHEALKNCLRSKNDSLFRSRGLTQMAKGLDWFIDWYEAADNPVMVYREVPCPQELINISGMRRP
ncbi:MAG: hypothetical protein JXJ04_26710 [Spirochaetales bacterium]|nr:hypothetical protein [Spirochaetales bacterium]